MSRWALVSLWGTLLVASAAAGRYWALYMVCRRRISHLAAMLADAEETEEQLRKVILAQRKRDERTDGDHRL